MSDRCSGLCCRHFYLPYSPDELAHLADEQRWRDEYQEAHPGADLPPELQGTIYTEIRLIADLAVYLGDEAPPNNRFSGGRVASGGIYTCKYLQPSGDCGIYERRPAMCRDYPYSKTCEWGDRCEWTEGRVRGLREWRETPSGRRLHLTLM